jgi:peptidoglycan/LPS O-acetylase OafA/YrhL
VLWGFVHRFYRFEASPSLNKLSDFSNLLKDRIGWMWIALGLVGMLLVSPAVALFTIVVFAGWMFFTGERREISWRGVLVAAGVFILGLFILSSSLNRSGDFVSTSPLHVITDWFQTAVKWDLKQAIRDSGWIQKIFEESPAWMRLPFIAIYGIFQPVLPAALIKPTVLIWKFIYIPRALIWYMLLPVLTFSFVAGVGQKSGKMRNLVLWLSLVAWIMILLASLRGGADLWDTPRYRTIFFVWQSIVAGYVWVWWRETRNAWLTRILLMEGVFLLVFLQWYISRYYRLGGQLPFGAMVAVILGLWGLILGVGLWRDRRSTPVPADRGQVDKGSSPAGKSRA